MKELRLMKEEFPGIKKEFDKLQFNMLSKSVPFNLTIDQFYDIWKKSGKWELAGKKANNLCLSRKSLDVGYSKGDVLICKRYQSVDYLPTLGGERTGNGKSFFTITPEGKFSSLREAGDVHGCTAMSILRRLNDKKNHEYIKEFSDGTRCFGTK